MRVSQVLCACLFLGLTVALSAESKNPADYPLRVHIFGHNETTFYHNRYPEESRGEGRADLFENGNVRGVDFNFDCSRRLKNSFGFETYPAKWKKPHQELTVLLPVFGQNNAFFTCDLHTQVREDVYVLRHNGLTSEPPAKFKTWMTKHAYDPEHGKNVPANTGAESTQ
ncbi:MAG TPA: hypothetical protein VNW54_15965 [Granulicella sp.]|jgi:hypothetical protein|nr:hypothetical protein [Granulicella sp.]